MCWRVLLWFVLMCLGSVLLCCALCLPVGSWFVLSGPVLFCAVMLVLLCSVGLFWCVWFCLAVFVRWVLGCVRLWLVCSGLFCVNCCCPGFVCCALCACVVLCELTVYTVCHGFVCFVVGSSVFGYGVSCVVSLHLVWMTVCLALCRCSMCVILCVVGVVLCAYVRLCVAMFC